MTYARAQRAARNYFGSNGYATEDRGVLCLACDEPFEHEEIGPGGRMGLVPTCECGDVERCEYACDKWRSAEGFGIIDNERACGKCCARNRKTSTEAEAK